MVRISVLRDCLNNIVNAEKRGKRQVLIRPNSKVIIKFLQVMQKHGYIGDLEIIDDHRAGKVVVELIGRINKCGVISPRFDVSVAGIEQLASDLLPSRQFGHLVLHLGWNRHQEARYLSVDSVRWRPPPMASWIMRRPEESTSVARLHPAHITSSFSVPAGASNRDLPQESSGVSKLVYILQRFKPSQRFSVGAPVAKMVRISVLRDCLNNIVNAEKRGKRQVLIRPNSKVIIKFLQVMQKHGYIGDLEIIDDHRAGKVVVELIGRINKSLWRELSSLPAISFRRPPMASWTTRRHDASTWAARSWASSSDADPCEAGPWAW
ncbi:unnamed protein product [Cladocopium goreaui]|uniref:40S ribosomal protein S15a n=1 Tax=Cladocopium goreaui TaxID=2562237 RepID=A0A9P1GGH6_9DINO|nr:unnamed protein product [Cladocopium goreaui]